MFEDRRTWVERERGPEGSEAAPPRLLSDVNFPDDPVPGLSIDSLEAVLADVCRLPYDAGLRVPIETVNC